MKPKPVRPPPHAEGPHLAGVMSETAVKPGAAPAPERARTPTGVRTQIYLTEPEHRFLAAEAARRGTTMAALIRSYVDQAMSPPAGAFEANSLLDAPADPSFVGPADGVPEHDHHIYGGPKRGRAARPEAR